MDPSAQARQDDEAERIARLRDRAEREEYPESWIPEAPGDEIAGELLRYTSAATRDGKPADIAILDTAEGERAVWLANIVLRDRFETLRPKPGQLVFIRFEGKRKSKAGRVYSDFTAEVERDQEAETSAMADVFAKPEAPRPRPRDIGRALHAPLEPNGRGDDDCPF